MTIILVIRIFQILSSVDILCLGSYSYFFILFLVVGIDIDGEVESAEGKNKYYTELFFLIFSFHFLFLWVLVYKANIINIYVAHNLENTRNFYI